MRLPLPPIPSRIVVAPMAGGPTTPELVAGAGEAGALGFLAAGYRTPSEVEDTIAQVRRRSQAPFGLNIFAPPGGQETDAGELDRFVERLRPVARALGVEPGEPRSGDDDYEAKCRVALELAPDTVSFSFGLPEAGLVSELHRRRVPVGVTITGPGQVAAAVASGADYLIAQGWEAGAHRGGLDDVADFGLLPLVRLVLRETDLPVVAAGGVADGAGVAAALASGATAAMLGTAFMRCPEAGTSPAHAAALARSHPTTVTRAFTGRNARGLRNRFTEELSAGAPAAYPAVHHATSPIRSAAREAGDLEHLHLWAGQAHELARDMPVRELVAQLRRDAEHAIRAVQWP